MTNGAPFSDPMDKAIQVRIDGNDSGAGKKTNKKQKNYTKLSYIYIYIYIKAILLSEIP